MCSASFPLLLVEDQIVDRICSKLNSWNVKMLPILPDDVLKLIVSQMDIKSLCLLSICSTYWRR
jgi:hypothetical protein